MSRFFTLRTFVLLTALSFLIKFLSLSHETTSLIHPTITHHEDSYSFPRNITLKSNLFFHFIQSGTCASHGFDDIYVNDVCAAAATYHGFDFHPTTEHHNRHSQDLPHGCFIHPRPSLLSAQNNDLIMNVNENCDSTKIECQCTPEDPCFCTSKFFVQSSNMDRAARNTRASGQFLVTWDLSLGQHESLLESIFLRAAFEQSVKDYINNDILCSDNIDVKGAEFFGVELPVPVLDSVGKLKAVSGNGKCKGDLSKCQKPLKVKKEKKVGKYREPDASKVVKAIHSSDEFCDIFLSSTIFDAFRERLMQAATFNYNVDVDVINDLEGSLDLKYDVSFEPAAGNGLDQVDEVDMDPEEPVSINPVCTESQCSTQKDVMRNMFNYFGIPVEENKHECLYQGINCNEEDMVTHIWMVNYGFEGKTIPDFFGSLPSLVGLYLGGNQLQGTVPESFGLLRNLKLLWLENNLLTGTLPSKLGNLRGLMELNLHENDLSGTIPSELAKLRKLRMLNLGRNAITGALESFYLEPEVVPPSEEGCQNFPNPFNGNPITNPFSKIFRKVNFKDIKKSILAGDESPAALETLILYENDLTGTIPIEWTLLTNLVDANIAENDITGSLPLDIGNLKKLKVLDFHGNSLTGTIHESIGELNQMKTINLYDNFFESTIPNTVGRLVRLDELLLDNNRLTGPIPTEIGLLTRLQSFTFSNNRMSGEVPSELGNLHRLSNLDLRGYSIMTQVGQKTEAGTIPKELGRLSNWKHVVFEGNGVAGSVPTEFGDLSSSKAMWMKNQELSGELPTELGKLPSVSLLSVGNNKMDGSIPTVLGEVGSLKQFDIGSNNINGRIPSEMGKLSSLSYIGLGNANVTGTTPTELGKLAALEYMVLANTKLTGNIPSEVGNLESMKSFMLAGGNISGTIPTELGIVSTLKNLDFESNGLTGTIPTEIANIQGLIKINLANNCLSGQIPSELGNLPNLQSINIPMNCLTGIVPRELGNVTTLHSLDLSNNEISSPLPSELSNIPNISIIDLSDNALIGTIPTEFSGLAYLVTFDLARNKFSGTIPTELFSSDAVGTIEILDFGGNNLVGTIPTEIGLLSSIKVLTLQNNSLSGTLPVELSNLEELQVMNLGGNIMTGTIPSELGSIESLEILDLGRNNLTGTIPSDFGLLYDLVYLDLGNNDLNGLIPVELENLTVEVILEQENNITEDGWAICDDKNYSIHNSTIDCLNFCGTVDEECTSLGVGNATCSDVGCSNGGKPGCTVNCRIDYSICTPGPDQQTVQLDLATDHSGWQTYWQMSGDEGVVLERPEDTYRNYDIVREFHCVKKDCYIFTLFDSGDDGLCCEDEEEDIGGGYSLVIDGYDVNASSFESSINFHSLSCTLPPTSYPSLEPSIHPTLIPSVYPSLYPTSAPSIYPSLIPTQVPSIEPNYELYNVVPNTQMFGTRIALSNDKVFVSNYHHGSGAVHVFDFFGRFITTLAASNGSDGDAFGKDLGASSTDIVVGAPNANGGEGRVYVYSLSSFSEKDILVANDHTTQGQQHFGEAIGVSDLKIVIGAPDSDSSSGALYIFDGFIRFQERKVVAPQSDGKTNGLFGNEVIVHNDRIFAGSPGYSNATGAVYKYDTAGNLMETIEGSSEGDEFGHSISAFGSVLVVGAPGSDIDGTNSGVANIYDLQNDNAILSTTIRPADGSTGFNFGYSVSVSSSSIMITAPKIDSGEVGVVYVFDGDGNETARVENPTGDGDDQYGYHSAYAFGMSVVGAPKYTGSSGVVNSGIAYIIRTLL